MPSDQSGEHRPGRADGDDHAPPPSRYLGPAWRKCFTKFVEASINCCSADQSNIIGLKPNLVIRVSSPISHGRPSRKPLTKRYPAWQSSSAAAKFAGKGTENRGAPLVCRGTGGPAPSFHNCLTRGRRHRRMMFRKVDCQLEIEDQPIQAAWIMIVVDRHCSTPHKRTSATGNFLMAKPAQSPVPAVGNELRRPLTRHVPRGRLTHCHLPRWKGWLVGQA